MLQVQRGTSGRKGKHTTKRSEMPKKMDRVIHSSETQTQPGQRESCPGGLYPLIVPKGLKLRGVSTHFHGHCEHSCCRYRGHEIHLTSSGLRKGQV